MSDTADLTTRQASALLGVHESSVKRWCDQGLLECSFTPGGHRRFDFDVMLDFARTSSLAPALLALDGFERPAWLGSEQLRQHAIGDGLITLAYEWLDRGPADYLSSLLQFLLDQGHEPERLCDLLLAPLARRVGDEWEAGRAGVGDEHRITQILLDALLVARPSPSHHVSLPVAIVGAAEGNRHDFGAQMVRCALEAGSWRVVYLGADVPTEDVAAQQMREKASLICLSFVPPQIGADVDRTLDLLALHYEAIGGPAVAVGGSAVSGAGPGARTGPFDDVRFFNRIEPFAAWAGELLSAVKTSQ